jgi:hypothetical protein
MAIHGAVFSHLTSDSVKMMSSGLSVMYARLSCLMNLKMLRLRTSALPVAVAGVAVPTRQIAYAISVATRPAVVTGGVLMLQGAGTGE